MQKILRSTLAVGGTVVLALSTLVVAPSAVLATGDEPGAPDTVTATAGDATIDVTWAAPSTDGGSPVTGYTAYAFPVPTVVAGGNGQGEASDQLTSPGGIAVASDGTVYVSDSASRVVRWLPGATAGTVVAGGNGLGYLPNQLAVTALDVDLGADAALYIVDRAQFGADPTGDRVVRWVPEDATGTVVAGGNGRGGSNNQLSQPNWLATTNDGTLFVNGFNAIRRWPNGSTSGIDLGGTPNFTYGFAFSGADLLQLQANSISRWSPSGGGFTQTANIFGTGAAGSSLSEIGADFAPPSGMVVDGNGDVYLGDTGYGGGGNRRVVRWTPGETEADLVYADPDMTVIDLDLDGAGNLYASDQTGNSVVRLDTAGTRTCSSATTSCTITGLTNGTEYQVAVVASNATGTGLTGHPADTVTPTRESEAPSFPTPTTTAPDATVGESYSFDVAATSDPADGELAYATTGTTPPGLDIDPATGTIAGTPTEAGTFTFTVTATNEVGPGSTEITMVVLTSDPTEPPTEPPTGPGDPGAGALPDAPTDPDTSNAGQSARLPATGASMSLAVLGTALLAAGLGLLLTRRVTTGTP